MKRKLENLISNAIKYGFSDTPIRLSAKEYSGPLLLSAHNHGRPIPPDQVESLFQVFRSAKAAEESDQKSWGIDLPYGRSVAESHGGSIDVDSAECCKRSRSLR